MIERKFTPLKDLKVTDEGPGTIEGYRSVFAEIDEGGDLIVKGFFADSIVEYTESGFSAHSHDWSFKEAVGFPVEAREDDYGFFVKSQFHSTGDAQDIRKKAKERMDAGKTVGFSFGYSVKDKSHIEAKDYKDQLPLYVKPERLQANLLKAQNFDRIRILKKGEVIEDSIVTAPMNKLAMATAVKSGKQEFHGMLAEEMAEQEPSFWRVESAYCRLIRKIAESAKNAGVLGNEFDWQARIESASSELATEAASASKQQIQSYLEGTDDEFYLKGITGTESFESFESMGTVLKKFTEDMQRNHDNRVKEGRMLSGSNRKKVQDAYDALGALLAASEPKPTEKEVDVSVLRTQSLRMQSLAMRALA